MKFYIIKPKSAKADEKILKGIVKVEPGSVEVPSLESADIAILQKGWTRSKTALAEFDKAKLKLHIPCREGCLYTDKYKVHLN